MAKRRRRRGVASGGGGAHTHREREREKERAARLWAGSAGLRLSWAGSPRWREWKEEGKGKDTVSSPSLWRAPVPFKDAIEQDAITPFPKPEAPEEEDEESQGDRDRRLMSSLPVKDYGERRYLQYQATWWPESAFQDVFAIQRRFRPRPSDVLLAFYGPTPSRGRHG
uniref:Uncharacterized protein n=1 Tax=Oryza glumipatula TaxID=40148 RepID=A0A0D9ZJH3_9ORYZ